MPVHTILHLTDLHLGSAESKGHYWNSEATELQLAEHDRRGLLGSLTRDLKHQQVKPDLLIVTGDLLDRGGEEGVAMTVELLGGLCKRLNLPHRRVVLLPGNHDVLRCPDPKARYVSFDAVCRRFYGNDITGFGPDTPAYLRVVRFDFCEELGIEMLALNSCEALDAATEQEHGSIGTAQRDRAEELLDPTEGMGFFRIAAMHHHLSSPEGIVRNDYSVMDDAALIVKWLAARRFHLVLHGHQHVDWQAVCEIDAWKIAITAGGSAGVASYARKDWNLQLYYQIIIVESATKGRRIRREYNPQTREWISAGRGAAEQALRFGPTGAQGTVDAAAAGVAIRGSGKSPTRTAVRTLMKELFPDDASFNAFCLDRCQAVHSRFADGMNRLQKENLLLQMMKPAAILGALQKAYPEQVAANERLLDDE